MNSENGLIRCDETLDSIRPDGLQVIQPKRGPRFAIDSVLLALYASHYSRGRIMELGCGHGIISLWLARAARTGHVTGIDLNAIAIDQARRSADLNRVSAMVTFQTVNVAEISQYFPAESFDTVVINPPFRVPGTGKVSPVPERAEAHHELRSDLDAFVRAAAYLLKTGGRCVTLHLAERLVEVVSAFRKKRLEPKRFRLIHAFSRSPAKQFLFVSIKGARPGAIIEKPLIIYRRKGVYTAELIKNIKA
ncbi:methyltransferase [bacterium]|nr:methyltransferase [bacterium]